jgi:hypothetical protein
LRGGLIGVGGLHGDDGIGHHFLVTVCYAQEHTILFDFEFDFMTDGENYRMFLVRRANVISSDRSMYCGQSFSSVFTL